DPRMANDSIDKARVRRVDHLTRCPPGHAWERELHEVPRGGDDDVRRLLGIVSRARVAPEGSARDRSGHAVNPRGFGEERTDPAPVLDMRGRALHLHMLARELLHKALERLAIALREHRAGALPVVGEHEEAIRPA